MVTLEVIQNGRLIEFVGNEAKGRISKRVFQENKARQISRKTNISYPLIHNHTCAYQGVRNVCFWKTPVLRFAFSPYYRRTDVLVIP